ncbi:unnamed protein product [Allacma fusca]|uniref:Phospholipid scramblase n=1 Tax=Allacma fusca TaxID=39272 RepID=A0A8J2KQC6_9HEXA|nr:unnamed protein product [Allacma fusca]
MQVYQVNAEPGHPADHVKPLGYHGTEDKGYTVESGPISYAYPPIPVPIQPDQPVVSQPQSGLGPQGYIQGHSFPINVPPGLEYLTTVDQLFVKQEVELLEVLCGCETKNKYKVSNSQGQVIYSVKEDTDCCTRNCCDALRPFDILIRDSQEREVIHLSRPFACGSCLCPCLLQSIDVEAPPGIPVGRVVQDWSMCIPQFRVLDASGETVLRIKGPCFTFSLCGSVEFQILSKDGSTQVGKISKQWSGLLREFYTDADNFGLSFPIDLDVRMKAVMLGALFLIDFMFFEE